MCVGQLKLLILYIVENNSEKIERNTLILSFFREREASFLFSLILISRSRPSRRLGDDPQQGQADAMRVCVLSDSFASSIRDRPISPLTTHNNLVQ
jgi:hypothetical protein